jgi:thiamine-monophosphate kinase
VKTLADLGEDVVVDRLTKLLSMSKTVIAGPGDDCAVVKAAGKGREVVLKTDVIVEGVHFRPDEAPSLVGRKAIARVLSDFAAMGAAPRHALVTVVCPSSMPMRRLEGVYRGMEKLASHWGVSVVGGELSTGPRLVLSVAMEGDVAEGRWSSRRGALVGDVLMVTGRLGGSSGGRHLKFEPRLEEGRWLARGAGVHAMMDLSDGLAVDLPRLARCSGVSYQVRLEDLPRSRGVSSAQAWGDGEDYELLVAVSAKARSGLLRSWKKRFPRLPLTAIGEICSGTPGGGNVEPGGGWDHFKGSAS